MDSIQEGIVTTDDLGIIIDKNKAIDRFIMDVVGQNHNILGKSIDCVLHKWPRWFSSCKSIQADEFEIDTSELGNKRYYVKVNPIYDKHLKKCGTVSILSDITERKIRDEELFTTAEWSKEQLKDLARELNIQKKKLESIIESMSDHCVVMDKEGNYTEINKAAKELMPSLQLKQVSDWLKIAGYYDILGNEINANSVPVRQIMNGERLTNFRLIQKINGQELHFNVNSIPIYDEKDEFVFGVICSSDITELVRHQKEIMRQNEQLEAILNTMSDMAILSITDKEGNFLRYSNAANDYFSENTFKVKAGTTYQEGVYFHSDGREISLYEMPVFKVLRGEKVTNLHFIKKDLNGETHFLFNGTPIYDKNGNLTNGVFFNMDITEQVMHKKLIPVTEQLVALNKLNNKLFTVFTHDIRNPMATMVSLIELLEEDEEYYSNENKEIIESVKEQFNHTYNIVENLLEWLKSQKEGLIYNPLICDLSKIVQEVVNMYHISASAKNICITSDIVEDMSVFVDIDMLELVIRNIISNAVKFTGNDGIITIQAYKSGNETIIAIKDTGNGMDEEKVKTLFCEAYASSTIGTAGEKGIGLGLLICKEFLIQNGGIIWVDSTIGIGSTFYFSIPALNI